MSRDPNMAVPGQPTNGRGSSSATGPSQSPDFTGGNRVPSPSSSADAYAMESSSYGELLTGSTYYTAYGWWNDLPEAWKQQILSNPYHGSYRNKGAFESIKKWTQEMEQNRQAMLAYDAEVYANYMSWLNSTPAEQARQLREAGYNPALMDAAPSDMSGSGNAANVPSGIASGASPGDPIEQAANVAGTIASIVSSCCGNVLTFANAVSAIKGIKKIEADISNVNAATGNLIADTANKEQAHANLVQEHANLVEQGKGYRLSNFLQQQNYLDSVRNYLVKSYNAGELTNNETGELSLPDFGDDSVNTYASQFMDSYVASRSAGTSSNLALAGYGQSIVQSGGFQGTTEEFCDYYNRVADLHLVNGEMTAQLEQLELEYGQMLATYKKQYQQAAITSGMADVEVQAQMATFAQEVAQGTFNSEYYSYLDPALKAGASNYADKLSSRRAEIIDAGAEQYADIIAEYRDAAFNGDVFAAMCYAQIMEFIYQPEAQTGLSAISDNVTRGVASTFNKVLRAKLREKFLPLSPKGSKSDRK